MKCTGPTIGKLVLLLMGLFISLLTLNAQCRLGIEIEGLKNNNGRIMLQLFDSSHKLVKQDTGRIFNHRCTLVFTGLTPGKYAIRYYHDENANMKMETNLVGKPTEGYGFSNNVTGKFGPPSFDKWLFILDADKNILLKPTY